MSSGLNVIPGDKWNPIESSSQPVLASDVSVVDLNTVQGVTIYLDDSNNFLHNYASNVKIYGGDGDDYLDSNVIYGSYGYVTLYGGYGKDTLVNNDPYTSLVGGAGNDSIVFSNFYKGVTINGGAGDDNIYAKGLSNMGAVYRFSYGDGNDTVTGYNSNDTIYLGNDYYALSTVDNNIIVSLTSGDSMTLLDAKGTTVKVKGGTLYNPNQGKYLVNYKANSLVSGSAYKDTVYNYAAEVTVSVGAENDYVYNTGESSSVNTGAGDDTVYNTGTGSKISLGDGNDSLNSWASGAVTAYGGDGNDFMYNSSLGTASNLNGDNGADTFLNIADEVKLYGDSGNDSITNWGNNSTLSGEADNDTLVNRSFANNSTWGQNNSLSGGDGKDVFSLYGGAAGITVNCGMGNDTIHNENLSSRNGVLYQFNSGYGSDVIYNYASNDTISIRDGSYYSLLTVGNNVVVSLYGGGGTISLIGASDKTINIDGGKAMAPVYNYEKNSLVAGSENNDSIYNYAGGVTVQGYDGNDYLYNSTSSNYTINNSYGYVTLDGGAGNDTIYSNDPFVSLNGGAGDDSITSGNWQGVTIYSGKGNDKINAGENSYGVLYQYASGDGVDTIYGYGSNDTITVTGANSWQTVASGNNVIVKVNGSDAMILNGAKGKTINVNPNSIITNYNANSLVSGSARNDTIYNYGNFVTVEAYGGDDYIYDNGSNVTIDAGDGSDTVYPYYVNSLSIQSGLGADSLNLYSVWYSTIDAGGGDDTILVAYRAIQDSINGGDGNDKISLSGSSFFEDITITGGDGNDTIYNNKIDDGFFYQYALGDGFDSITYWGANDVLALDGNYYTRSTVGNDVVVSVGTVDGENFIASGAVTLSGAKTKNVNIANGTLFDPNVGRNITNYNNNSLLSGSDYADTVTNYGKNVTVNTGKGNDSIYNKNSFSSDSGNGEKSSINAGDGDDYIDNYGSSVTVNAGNGNDTVRNDFGVKSLLNTGDGDDSILNATGNYATVNAGANNDTVYNHGWYVLLDGGTGNDSIVNSTGQDVTITAGKDNDTISLMSGASQNLINYAKGDGSDIIFGYKSDDTISITGADSWSTQLSGNDILINIADSGTITLSDAKDLTLNIYPKKSEVMPQDIIKKFMYSLDKTSYSGATALNQAVNYATNGYFKTIDQAVNQMVADCASSNDYTSFLRDYCDINLTNADTGAISGSDAGGSTVKDKYSIVPESGNLENFTGNSFTTNGLTIRLSKSPEVYNSPRANYSDLENNTQQYIWQALKTWWAKGALNLIAENYGDNYGFSSASSATVKEMYFGFVNNPDDTSLATTWSWWYVDSNKKPIDGKTIQLSMTVNMKYYNSLIVGNENGKMSGSDKFYLDRVLSHEFTHAVMSANINYASDLPMFIKEGMSELTHGIDDERTADIINLANNSASLDTALNQEIYYSYAGGYMFLRYLAKQGAAHFADKSNASALALVSSDNMSSAASSDASTVTVKKSVLTLAKEYSGDVLNLADYSAAIKTVNASALSHDILIYGNTSANSIVAGMGNDTINANTGNDTIDGGEGSDQLSGDAGNDKLTGSEGSDTLNGGTGNDTLTGGDGEDVFIFGQNAGKDVITDYTAGEDTIQFVENQIVGSSVNGSDIVFALEMGDSVTVKGGKGKQITTIDKDGNESTDKYSTDEEDATLIITNKNQSRVVLDDQTLIVDASSAAKFAVNITGNDLDNSIVGGKKNDTLNGSAGKNTLKGGDGNDIFIYDGGSDTVVDYAAGKDKISLGSAQIQDFSVEDKDVTLNLDDEKTLTLLNAAGKKISFVDGKKTSTKIFSANGLFNDKSTAVTLSASTTNYTAQGKVASVDGSAASGTVSIVGNASNNYLVAGKNGSTLTGGGGNDTFVYGGGSVTIADYTAGKDKISLGSAQIQSFTVDGNDVTLNFGDGKTLTIKDASGKKISFVNGKKTSTKIFSTSQIVNDKSTAVTLSASTTNYTAPGKVVSIDGSAASGEISIVGNASNNYIVAGNNGSTLDGGDGNDTLNGGTGKDLFLYTSGKKSGKDVIQNFGEGDALEISGTKVTNAAFNSSQNVVLTLGDKNTITLKKFSDDLTFTDDEGNKTFSTEDGFIRSGNSVTVPAAFVPKKNVVVTFDEDISVIDAHFSAKALNLATNNDNGVSISGGSKNDTLTGGEGSDSLWGGAGKDLLKGGEGSDSLNGGKGDDLLYGGDGSDTFIYKPGDGKDTIYDFTSDDLLTIDGGTFKKATFNSNTLTLTFKSGSLVFKNVDAATEFNINGATWHVSGNTLAK